jgi:ADP-heptose:LPS heptosyltransferase
MEDRAVLHPSPRRIAVFRAIFLGDLLLAVPALRAFRAGFPQAEITFIGLPWAESFIARFHRYVDRFVQFTGYPGIVEVPVFPERTRVFLAEQRAYGYDLVVQMHGSGGASNPFCLALGGRATAGYYLGSPPPGLSVAAPYPNDQPEVWRNLGLARLVGCGRLDPALEFPLSPEDRAEAAALLAAMPADGRPRVGLHPGASAPSRRWPAEHFAALANELARRFGAQIVLTGSTAERPIVQDVAARLETRPLDLSGRTSLGGLAALIASLDLFVSNDTGPAHLADALCTPSITIFGPADHDRWAPLNRQRHRVVLRAAECDPACGRECVRDQRCLRGIRPGLLLEMAAPMLSNAPPAAVPVPVPVSGG